jgi:hypothetical protein
MTLDEQGEFPCSSPDVEAVHGAEKRAFGVVVAELFVLLEVDGIWDKMATVVVACFSFLEGEGRG